jgi:hypothetical protein
MSEANGYFVDWNGDLRSTDDPGGGYFCELDRPARYVAVMSKSGALIHEATLYKAIADLEKAGINAQLVPGSKSWGSPKEGF